MFGCVGALWLRGPSKGEAVVKLEVIRSTSRSAEQQASIDPSNGVIYPDLVALLAKIDVGAEIPDSLYLAIAEVVRDLYRSDRQPEQSYSERQLYESALDRMAREIACVKKLDDAGAISEIEGVLEKSSHRGEKPAAASSEEKAA